MSEIKVVATTALKTSIDDLTPEPVSLECGRERLVGKRLGQPDGDVDVSRQSRGAVKNGGLGAEQVPRNGRFVERLREIVEELNDG